MKIILKYWQLLTPITQKISIFILINILINIGLFILPSVIHIHDTDTKESVNFHETALSHTSNFLTSLTSGSTQFDLWKQSHSRWPVYRSDSWEPMQKAFDYLKVEHKKLVYDEIFFNQKIKFQYPTTSLIFFSFLDSIDGFLKFIDLSWYGILKRFSWLCIVVTIFL